MRTARAAGLMLVLAVAACGGEVAGTDGTVVAPSTTSSGGEEPVVTSTEAPVSTTEASVAGTEATVAPSTTPDGGGEVTADRVVEVSYMGGQVSVEVMAVPGEEGMAGNRLPVPLGSTVEIVATSDVDEEVHVHGYDATAEVMAGETATLRFVADVPGIFEVEFEESGILLFELEVS